MIDIIFGVFILSIIFFLFYQERKIKERKPDRSRPVVFRETKEEEKKELEELPPYKRGPRQVIKIGRNSRCHCGSGKKLKNCCKVGVERNDMIYVRNDILEKYGTK